MTDIIWPQTAFIQPSYLKVCMAQDSTDFKKEFVDFAVRFTSILFACNKVDVKIASDLAEGFRTIEWTEDGENYIVTFPVVEE